MKKLKFILSLILSLIIFINLDNLTIAKDKYSWDLTSIYSNNINWENDFQKIKSNYIPKLNTLCKKINSNISTNTLIEIFKITTETTIISNKLYVYSSLKEAKNEADSSAIDMLSRSKKIYLSLQKAKLNVDIALQKLSVKKLNSFINDKKLKNYVNYLKQILYKKEHNYINDTPELLDMYYVKDLPYDTYSKLAFINSSVSDSTYKDEFSKANKYQESFASMLSNKVDIDNLIATELKSPSYLELSLKEDDISKSVYDNLILVINNNLSYLHEYVTLRKKYLKLDNFHSWDFKTPLCKKNYDTLNYEDSQKILLDSLTCLGSDYKKNLQLAFNNNWIDVYSSKNKYTGGFTISTYNSHPYILINYDNTFLSLLDLSHEMGHAMNFYYISKNHPANDVSTSFNPPAITSEIPSTTNELITLKYLIKNAKDDDEKLFYLDQLAKTIICEIYDACLYSEFEQEIHKKAQDGYSLTASSLNDIWEKLILKYYGNDFNIDELDKTGWATIPHFYMDFYNYKYALSISSANKLSKILLKGNPDDLKTYKSFLMNSNLYNCDNNLLDLNIDLYSTSQIRETLLDFNDTINQIQTILKRSSN